VTYLLLLERHLRRSSATPRALGRRQPDSGGKRH
jgi:hypothetical protein